MTQSSPAIGVLLALFLLTDGDTHDAVLAQHLRAEVNKPQQEVDQAVATLVRQGLAQTVLTPEGVCSLSVTRKAVRVFAELASRTN